MKVEPWRTGSAAVPAQPDVVGDHPQFYVARGSHSFYTTPGTHEVSPYDAENSPIGCGKFDTDSVVPPSPPSVGSDVKITFTVLLKTLVGGLLGAIFTGYVAGLIEAIIIASTPFGAAPSGDPPNPDVTPSAEDGLTVRPAGLPIPGHNDRLNDWGCRQGLIVNNRTYDFVVDRGTQIWWPSDDGTKGFRGRWGQRVTSDPLSRRAGPRFPEFWKMFLTALESGFSEGTLTRPHP
jgi:hypothetical protein